MPEELRQWASADAYIWSDTFAAWPTLSEAEREALRPFVARPSDPVSVFHPVTLSIQQSGATKCILVPVDSASYPIRVWYDGCKPALEQAAENVLTELERVWTPEILFLTPPLATFPGGTPEDDGGALYGGDRRFDAYIVSCNSCNVTLRGYTDRFDIVAAVWPDARPRGNGDTSFLIVEDRVALSKSTALHPKCPKVEATLHQIIAHEFFHVLQKTHHANAPRFISEGTARWVDIKFGGGYETALTCEFPYYQAAAGGLPRLEYTASIWWHYVAKRAGGDRIADVWKALGKLPPTSSKLDFTKAAMDATKLPLAEAFDEFSVRNLNQGDGVPGGGVRPPIRWWKDVDEEWKWDERPAGMAPFYPAVGPPLPGAWFERPRPQASREDPLELPFPRTLESFGRAYVEVGRSEAWNVGIGTPNARQIRVDFGPLTPEQAGALSLQVLWRSGEDMTWRLDHLTEPSVLCDPIDNIYFILTNSAFTDHEVQPIRVRPLAVPCECADLTWVDRWELTSERETATLYAAWDVEMASLWEQHEAISKLGPDAGQPALVEPPTDLVGLPSGSHREWLGLGRPQGGAGPPFYDGWSLQLDEVASGNAACGHRLRQVFWVPSNVDGEGRALRSRLSSPEAGLSVLARWNDFAFDHDRSQGDLYRAVRELSARALSPADSEPWELALVAYGDLPEF